MTINGNKLIIAWLCGCALVSAGIAFWPQTKVITPANNEITAYSGVEHELRKTSAPSEAIFILAGSVTPTQAAPQAASPILVGIVGRSAYLKSSSSGETANYNVGESLDGWKLLAVRARTITLEGPAGKRDISLFEKPVDDATQAGLSTTHSNMPIGPTAPPPPSGG